MLRYAFADDEWDDGRGTCQPAFVCPLLRVVCVFVALIIAAVALSRLAMFHVDLPANRIGLEAAPDCVWMNMTQTVLAQCTPKSAFNGSCSFASVQKVAPDGLNVWFVLTGVVVASLGFLIVWYLLASRMVCTPAPAIREELHHSSKCFRCARHFARRCRCGYREPGCCSPMSSSGVIFVLLFFVSVGFITWTWQRGGLATSALVTKLCFPDSARHERWSDATSGCLVSVSGPNLGWAASVLHSCPGVSLANIDHSLAQAQLRVAWRVAAPEMVYATRELLHFAANLSWALLALAIASALSCSCCFCSRTFQPLESRPPPLRLET